MFYLVWVGGIPDNYNNSDEAKAAVKDWQRKGYDDVQLQVVED